MVLLQKCGRYFTGPGASKISLDLKKAMEKQRTSVPNSCASPDAASETSKINELTQKWLVLVCCRFPKNMYLLKGTHVLYSV